MTDLVRKDSIEELCGHRARALQLYAQAYETIRAATEAHRRACVGQKYISAIDPDAFRLMHIDNSTGNGAAKFNAHQRASIDRDMWRGLLINTRLESMMDAVERKAFDAGLEKDPPEITPDTVLATLSRLAGDTPKIFRRGLVAAFSALSNEYKSHDGFKIGPRMVFRNIVDVTPYRDGGPGGGRRRLMVHLSQTGGQRLRDLDRVVHILDGKAPPEYGQGIEQAMRDAIGRCDQDAADATWQAETPYFTVKFYQNRNGHLSLRRPDIRDKANRLIAEHYGAALGAGANVASERRGFV